MPILDVLNKVLGIDEPIQEDTIKQYVPEEPDFDIYENASKEVGVERALLEAVDTGETGKGKSLVSPTGVRGRFQLTKPIASKYGINRENPKEAAIGAAKHINQLMTKYDDLEKVLAAYNTGEDVVDEAVKLSSEKGTDWKNEIENTKSIDNVVQQIVKVKKQRKEPTVSFINEKRKKIDEVRKHRENILNAYNKLKGLEKPEDLDLTKISPQSREAMGEKDREKDILSALDIVLNSDFNIDPPIESLLTPKEQTSGAAFQAKRQELDLKREERKKSLERFEKAYKEFKYKPVTGKELTIEEDEAGELKPLEDKSIFGKYKSKLNLVPKPLRTAIEKIDDVNKYKSNINLFLSGLYKHKSNLIGDEVPPHTGEKKTDLRAYESAIQKENELGAQTLEKLNLKPDDFEFAGIYVTPTSLNQKLGNESEEAKNSVRSYMARQKQGEFIKKSSEKAEKAEDLFPIEARIARLYKKYDDIESEKRSPIVGQLTKGWDLGGFKQDASKTLAYLALVDPEKAKELVPAINDIDGMIQDNDQDLNKFLKFGKDLAQTLEPMVTTGAKSMALSYVGLSPIAFINNYEEWGLSATGDMFQTMINENVSPNTAINTAFAYSIPYTAIESAQWGGFSKVAEKFGEKAFKGKLISILKDYSKKNAGKKLMATANLFTNAASETLEEAAQGFVEGYAVEVAKQIDGVSEKDFKVVLKNGLKNALDSGIESAPQMLAISILSAFTGGVGGKLLKRFSPNVKKSVETITNNEELTDDQKLEEIVQLIKNPEIKEEIKNVVVEDVVSKVIPPEIPQESDKKATTNEQVDEKLLDTEDVQDKDDVKAEEVTPTTETEEEIVKEAPPIPDETTQEEDIPDIPDVPEDESEKKVSEKLEIQVEKSKEKITGKKSEFLLRRKYSKLPAQIKTLIDKKYGNSISIEQKVLLGEKINETDNFDKEKIDESLSDIQESLGVIPDIKDKQDVVEAPSQKIEILQKKPFEMTKKEWENERDKLKSNFVQEKITKTSKNEQTKDIISLENLLYGVNDNIKEKLRRASLKETDKDFIKMSSKEAESLLEKLDTPIIHKQIIEKALSEGKKINDKILNEYPDLKNNKIVVKEHEEEPGVKDKQDVVEAPVKSEVVKEPPPIPDETTIKPKVDTIEKKQEKIKRLESKKVTLENEIKKTDESTNIKQDIKKILNNKRKESIEKIDVKIKKIYSDIAKTQKDQGVKNAGSIGKKIESTSRKDVQTREIEEKQQAREEEGRSESVRVRKPSDEGIQEEVDKKQKDIVYKFDKEQQSYTDKKPDSKKEIDNLINSNLVKDIEITEDSRYDLNGKTTILRDNAVIIHNPQTNKTRIVINKNLSADKKAKALVHEVIGHIGISNVLNQNKEIHRQLKDLLWSEEAKGNLEDLKIAYSEELNNAYENGEMNAYEDVLMSEWLANSLDEYLNKKEPGIFKKVYNAIRDFLIKVGIVNKKDVNDFIKVLLKEMKTLSASDFSPDIRLNKVEKKTVDEIIRKSKKLQELDKDQLIKEYKKYRGKYASIVKSYRQFKEKIKQREIALEEIKSASKKYAKDILSKNFYTEFEAYLGRLNPKTEAGRETAKRRIVTFIENLVLREEKKAAKDDLIKTLKKVQKILSVGKISNEIRTSLQDQITGLKLSLINKLTTEEVNLINTSLQEQIAEAQKERSLFVQGRKIAYDELLTNALDNLDKSKDIKQPSLLKRTSKKAYNSIWGVRASTMETVAEQMDIADIDKETSSIGQVFFGNFAGYKGAFNNKLEIIQSVEDDIKSTFTEDEIKSFKNISIVTSTVTKKGKRYVPFVETNDITTPSGVVIKDVNRAHQIALYLHGLNDHNRKAFTENRVHIDNNIDVKKYKFTEEDIEWLMSPDRLTPVEKKLADFFYDTLNGRNKDLLLEASTKIQGFPMKVRDNYFPLNRINFYKNFLTSNPNLAKKDDMKSDTILGTKTSLFFLENAGHLKEINENAKGDVVLEDAFVSFFNSVNLTASYSAYSLPLRFAKQLVNDERFKDKAIDKGFIEHIHEIERYINDIEGEHSVIDSYEKFYKRLIGNAASNILGSSPFIALRQVGSYLSVPSEIDSKYWIKAVAAIPFGSDISKTEEKIKNSSPMIRARLDSAQINAELGGRAILSEVGRVFGKKLSVTEYPTVPLHKMDTYTIMRVVKAAQLKIEETTKLEGDEKWEKIAELSEKIIRRTQPMWAKEFRSGLGRSKSIYVRLATFFTSATNAQLNVIKRSFMRYSRGDDSLAKFLYNMLLSWVSTAALMVVIQELSERYKGREMNWKKRFVSLAQKSMAPFYFAEKLTSPIIDGINTSIEGRLNTYATENAFSTILDTYHTGTEAFQKDYYKIYKNEDLKAGDYEKLTDMTVNLSNLIAMAVSGIPVKNMYSYGYKIPKEFVSEISKNDYPIEIKSKELGYEPQILDTFEIGDKKYRMYKTSFETFKTNVNEYVNKHFTLNQYNKYKNEELKKDYIKQIYKNARKNALSKIKSNLEKHAFEKGK